MPVRLGITRQDVALAVHAHLTAAGWLSGEAPEVELREVVDPVVAWLVDTAAEFEVGDIIERRLDEVVLRERASR